jgi:hypothetical protein
MSDVAAATVIQPSHLSPRHRRHRATAVPEIGRGTEDELTED